MNLDHLFIIPGTGVIVDKHNNNYILNITQPRILNHIKEAVPFVATCAYPGGTMAMLPISDDTLQLLNNLHLPTKELAPFNWEYTPPLIEGRYAPMEHQLASAAFMSIHKRSFNTSTMRTGKTGSVVMATDYLQQTGRASGVLVVATVSNLSGVWHKTITETLPHKRAYVVHGSRAERRRILSKHADYYIINYDGVKLVEAELVSMVENGLINTVVLDELTHYGNPESGRWISMNKVVNGKTPVKYCVGLTGSPGDNPMPIYGFVKMVHPDKMPCLRKTTWQELTQYRYGNQAWQWRNKADTSSTIYRTMQPTIRYDKKDIMDLPPIVRQQRDCSLSKEQSRMYQDIIEEMVAMTADGQVIEAVHKASMLHKLFQIALGSVRGTEGNIIQLDNKDRLNTILEVIAEASQKVVVFSPYTGAINKLVSQLQDKKFTVEKVDGSVTGKRRTQIFQQFQEEKDPHIIVCHPETTAFGVELAAADTMIFNGPPLSGGFIYEQALERLSSLRQQASQIAIVQLAATKEEKDFFNGLDNGVRASEIINNMFAGITQACK